MKIIKTNDLVPAGVCPTTGGSARRQVVLPAVGEHAAVGQGRPPHEGRKEQLQASPESRVQVWANFFK